MPNIGIFFGSDTGSTRNAAELIQRQLVGYPSQLVDIAECSKEDVERCNILLLGIPTVTDGEAQSDWKEFLPTLGELDFTGKYLALFGCADQDYSEHFADALGTLRDTVEPRGATMVGHWPTAGYTFDASKALVDQNNFVGLVIDADGQPEFTNDRISGWVRKVLAELAPALSH